MRLASTILTVALSSVLTVASALNGSDDCNTPDAIAGQGQFSFDNTLATTGLDGQNEALCGTAPPSPMIPKDVWFSWTADVTGVAEVNTCISSLNTKMAAYPGGGCPIVPGSAIACNDDSCGTQSKIVFNVVAGTAYMLQVGNDPLGTAGGSGLLTISIIPHPVQGIAYCFCDVPLPSTPCANPGATGNGCLNGSDANGANLTSSGSAILLADTLVLSASGLPPDQPGLYFQGDSRIGGGAGVIFGDGLRCAGGNVTRLGIAVSDAAGTSSTAAFPTPISVLGGVTAGDTKHYQLWYRDPESHNGACGYMFNLTNGYTQTW